VGKKKETPPSNATNSLYEDPTFLFTLYHSLLWNKMTPILRSCFVDLIPL
jgi:hypothetical protein